MKKRRSFVEMLPRKSIRNWFGKKFLFGLICLLFLLVIYFLWKKDQFCDPNQHLPWFCPWPDPKLTTCSWNNHFPKTFEQNHSPEMFDQSLKTLPNLRSLFEYNNQTLIQCSESTIDLLIFVISKCSHFSIRQSIRRTWANIPLLEKSFPKLKLKLLFLVDLDSHSQRKIELEHIYHKDIVQIINLPEQYQYVTERESALYQFVQYHCQQTKYLFKTDDDIFLNTFLILSFLNNQFDSLDKYTLIGYPIEYGLVVRFHADQIGERYIITEDEYSCPRYPTFLSGFGYLMSFSTLRLLSNAYFVDRKPFPLSDVYFTGLLPEMFNLPRKTFFTDLNYRYLSKCNEDFFSKGNNPLACAATDEHFSEDKQSKKGDRSLMNEYNLYWTKLTHIYRSI